MPKEGDRVGIENYPSMTARIKSVTPHHEYDEFGVLYAMSWRPTFMDRDYYDGIKTFYPDDNAKFIYDTEEGEIVWGSN